jgi:hypothetical protein
MAGPDPFDKSGQIPSTDLSTGCLPHYGKSARNFIAFRDSTYRSRSRAMEKIGAWIRNPVNNWLKGQTKRSALFVLYCEKPETCDLLQKENSCINCGIGSCRFGRKSGVDGPTKAARSFYSTLSKWRKEHEAVIDKLAPLAAYNRIFRTHGHYYLPYSFMAESLCDNSPLESKWVPEENMTAELLAKICQAQPRALFGGAIRSYQDEQVPKFIADLNCHYPAVFALLPDDQKARLTTVSYVGRKADITTCAPGKYVFSKSTWEWDGAVLRGKSMLFQPAKGDVTITITPAPGESVIISDNAQVTPETRFLD